VKDYNIISNKYWKDHDNKFKRDVENEKELLEKRYWDTHDFDYIKVLYLDKEKQDNYIKDRYKKMMEHGKHAIDKLPPSLRYRETIYFDRTKPVPK
jgi:hypothetical protein